MILACIILSSVKQIEKFNAEQQPGRRLVNLPGANTRHDAVRSSFDFEVTALSAEHYLSGRSPCLPCKFVSSGYA